MVFNFYYNLSAESSNTEQINAVIDKIILLLDLLIKYISLNMQSQSNSVAKLAMYGSLITAGATIVLAILTASYVYTTNKILKSNNLLVKQNIMPYLIIFDPTGDAFGEGGENVKISFRVQNCGRGTAFDVNIIKYQEGCKVIGRIIKLPVEDEGVLILVTTTKELEKLYRPKRGTYDELRKSETGARYSFEKLNITIEYSDMFGEKNVQCWPSNDA